MMSLPNRAIDRLFERLSATYGAAWTRHWADVPMQDVKTAWAHELGTFANSLGRIAWALENLPPRCPNIIEFKLLCRQAPAPALPQLPEPKADPAKVAAELAKLGDLRVKTAAAVSYDSKDWAKKILAKAEAGQKLMPATLRCAREALGVAA